MTLITVEQDGHVATIWLDRPEVRNAVNQQWFVELRSVMDAVSTDDEIRAVVIAARGGDFSVGLDLKAPGPSVSDNGPGPDPERSPAERARAHLAHVREHQAAITAVRACPKPVIAAIHGYCIGAGLDLAAACDIRVAAADAKLSLRETRLAVVDPLGGLQRLPAILSRGHMAELAYTGKIIDSARAMAIGLVNDVLPDAESTVAEARRLASEIAANSPLAVQGVKAVLAAGEGMTEVQGLEYVGLWQSAMLQSFDFYEAVAAFRDKRTPVFTGR
jgi:enoyl-CoA hydratase